MENETRPEYTTALAEHNRKVREGWAPPPPPAAPSVRPPSKLNAKLSRKQIIVGLVTAAVVIGFLAAHTKPNGSTPPANSPATSPVTADPSAHAAVIIQAKVCDLLSQGYSTGQIVDALASMGYGSPTIAATVAAAAANC